MMRILSKAKQITKNTNGTCQFLGHTLVSWFSTKKLCGHVYNKSGMYRGRFMLCPNVMDETNFDLKFDTTYILYDSTSAINLSKNSIFHYSIKHIDVRYYFLKDHIEFGDIKLIAYFFAKSSPEDQFCSISCIWECALLILESIQFLIILWLNCVDFSVIFMKNMS